LNEDLDLVDRFDSIFMLNVLEHVVDPVVALNKAASLLAPHGTLIVHVPNAAAINRKIAVAMGSLESCEELSPFDIHVAGHRRSYTLQTLKAEFGRAGLVVEKTGGVFYKMLSTPQIDWLLKHGPWEEGGFGWGRVGAEKSKDWRAAFCRACYEMGKERPEDCNVIYVVARVK
jgi:SAM-dependent methyltransferase